MILNNRIEDLNLVFKLRVEEFDSVIFVTSNNTKCFSCGKEGHQAKVCPQRNQTADTQEQQEGTGGGVQQEGQEGQEETSGVQQESQVSEEGQEVTGEIPKEGQVNEEGQEGTGGVQQVDQVSEEGQEGTGGVQQVDQVNKEGQEGTGGVQQVDQVGEREQVSDIDMEGDEEVLKVPHLKRKTRSSSGSSKAKKGAVKKGGRGAAESETTWRPTLLTVNPPTSGQEAKRAREATVQGR